MKILIIGSKSMQPSLIFYNSQYHVYNINYKGIKGIYIAGVINNNEIFYISRDFGIGDVAPHKIDYIEIFNFIKINGIEVIFTTSVVGSLYKELSIGSFLILDQFIDFTKHKPFTTFSDKFEFIDFSYPFDLNLRKLLKKSFILNDIPFINNGCYVCVDGPRFETSAEVKAFRILGGDVVGMTLVPEIIFAKENKIPYASVATVSNFGAGIALPFDTKSINDEAYINMQKLAIILRHTLELI